MSVDTVAVNRLLDASRAAHTLKKRAAGTVDRDGNVLSRPNYSVAEQKIVEALSLRIQAHEADPEHTASGWRDDTASDADLIKFYVAYSRPFIAPDDLAKVIARFPAYQDIGYIP